MRSYSRILGSCNRFQTLTFPLPTMSSSVTELRLNDTLISWCEVCLSVSRRTPSNEQHVASISWPGFPNFGGSSSRFQSNGEIKSLGDAVIACIHSDDALFGRQLTERLDQLRRGCIRNYSVSELRPWSTSISSHITSSLRHVSLSSNALAEIPRRVDHGTASPLGNMKHLVLSSNRISSWISVDAVGEWCYALESLGISDNPVTFGVCVDLKCASIPTDLL